MPSTRHKPLALYPQWCMELMSRFLNGSEYESLPMSDKRSASSSAHMFNRARIAFCREVSEPRQTEIVLDIVCRITNIAPGAGLPGSGGVRGEYTLEFTRRGLAVLADEMKGVKSKFETEALHVPGLEEVAPAAPAAVKRFIEDVAADHTEAALQRFMQSDKAEGQDKGKGPEQVQQPQCAHEWDTTQTRCLLCGAPYAE